jgi:hypothetical protein
MSDDQSVGLLQVGADLAEKDRAGEAFADLIVQRPFDFEGERAGGRHLAFGAHQAAGHFVDRADLLDRHAGVDGFQDALPPAASPQTRSQHVAEGTDSRAPADIFVISAFVGVLEPTLAAHIVDEDGPEAGGAALDVVQQLLQRIAAVMLRPLLAVSE